MTNYVSLHIAIALVDGPLHGYGIKKSVQTSSHESIQLGAGTLYGALKRMVDQGLIEIQEDIFQPPEPSTKDRTESRKYYALTELGKKQLGAELAELDRVAIEGRKARLKLSSNYA
jgi:DNA-binding PadR family transcriptional regulator